LPRFSRPRYHLERATFSGLPRRSCSGDSDARVRGPSEGRVFCRRTRESVSAILVSGACTSKSACGRRSLPGRPLDIRCRRCVRREGRRPVLDAGPNQGPRSDADPRRSTPSRGPGCLPPWRSAMSVRARIAPCPNLPRRSLAHAAHTFSPGWGECFLTGHCKHQSAVTRDPWRSFEEQAPFLPPGRSFRISRAWD